MLDWIEKLRKLMQVGTGLKKSEGWYQKFIRKMEPIVPVRGFIQHLDRELTVCMKHQMPFFGILGACVAFPRAKGFSIVIALPDGYKAEHLKTEDQSMCFDVRKLCTPPVDHVRMRFGTWMLNLTLLHRVIQEAHGAFATYVDANYGGMPNPNLAQHCKDKKPL